jgi:bifunctional non-homologous end joining protein LigD
MPSEARRRGLPATFEPELATPVDIPPSGDDWIHEIKYDGYRLLARIEGGGVRLISRNGKDWSGRFPGLIAAVSDLGLGTALLDGEVAAVRPDGSTSFQDLQNAIGGVTPPGVTLRYFLFDVIVLEGEDLTSLPLIERKRRLELMLSSRKAGAALRYGDHVEGNGPRFFEQACRFNLEGIISKRRSSPYRQGRTRDWLKIKCLEVDEFVVGGFTEPGGTRAGFGALLVGGWDSTGALRFAGRVGTGFKDAELVSIAGMLEALAVETSPFEAGPREAGMHWVRPELVVQVAYSELTSDGLLRHPSYRGLRDDRDPATVPLPGEHPGSAAGPPRVAGVTISSPGKRMYPEDGITKLDVAHYFEAVAEWMLPYAADRPITLVRCPGGIADCFYQKHIEGSFPDAIRTVQIREDESGQGEYPWVDTAAGLVGLAQLGVLEIHTWGSKRGDLERPDRFTIDLDPDPAVPWLRVAEAALELRGFLGELGLTAFLKTTGGKGLHIVVPILPDLGWDEVKEFTLAVAAAVAGDWPGRYTLNMSKEKRRGRILIDYLRNGRGATAVEAYSTRARPGAPVAAPVRWEELAEGVRPDSFSLRNLPERLKRLGTDPWEEYGQVRQGITPAMVRRLGLA